MKKWIGRLLVDPLGTLVYGCRIAYALSMMPSSLPIFRQKVVTPL